MGKTDKKSLVNEVKELKKFVELKDECDGDGTRVWNYRSKLVNFFQVAKIWRIDPKFLPRENPAI